MHVQICRRIKAGYIIDSSASPALPPLVAALLQYFFKNGAMLIDCAPEPELLSSAYHNSLVEMPKHRRGACPCRKLRAIRVRAW